ncbi:MAG: hypothetical protein HY056_02860 [Proteobacteria bacterium]|nr:hypothetical protein [Pseudomonadota bacterium]
MDAFALMVIYIFVTAALQLGGFLVSEVINAMHEGWGLMSFLTLFLGAFFVAWPIAVNIADRIFGKAEASKPLP